MKISATKKRMIIKGLKIAIGSTVACFVADLLHFEYAASAGIIALLSIQDTRRDTFSLALNRVFSFVLTMAIAYVVSFIGGFGAISFGVFILLMVVFCYLLSWDGTVSANAVFGTHVFMMAKDISVGFILNEVGILGIGIVIALILNFKMSNNEKQIVEYMDRVEKTISSIIAEMALELGAKSELSAVRPRITTLMHNLDKYIDLAIENKDITLKEHSEFYINYFSLRKNQCVILLHIYRSIMSIEDEAYKDESVVTFIHEMAETFNIHNNDVRKNERLREILDEFHSQPLPNNREEFEARAAIYHILKEFEEFIKVKKVFIDSLTHEQKRMYLKMSHEM